MQIRYEWRELTDDGLLKKPEIIGPYYDETELNGLFGEGYKTKEEAIEDYNKYCKVSPWRVQLVLVEMYDSIEED